MDLIPKFYQVLKLLVLNKGLWTTVVCEIRVGGPQLVYGLLSPLCPDLLVKV